MKKNSFLPQIKFLFSALSLVFSQHGFSADNSVSPADNSSVDQQFIDGLNQRDAGDYEASVHSFESILSAEPSLNRARAELALSYYKALNYASAKAEAQKVLADPTTPEGVKVTIRNFLDLMDQESKKHLFTPYLSFGFGHDDNINVGPNSGTINLGGVVLVSNALPISRNFAMMNVGVSHRYLSPEPVKLFNHNAAFIWQSNANYYRSDYNNSGAYDLDVLSLSTGPAAVVANRYRVGTDFTFDHIMLGGHQLAQFYGISPNITLNVNQTTDVSFNAKFQVRDFEDSFAPGRDSNYQSFTVSGVRTFMDTKLALQAGATLFYENADASRFSQQGSEFTAGGSYKAWSEGSIYLKDAYKHSDFEGKEFIFNQARNEYENRATVGINHHFSLKFIKDWTLDMNATHTTNASNVTIYDYRRTQYSISFSKYF